MVFLNELANQWPWNPQAKEDLSDKEIYTHDISMEDASKLWRVPILAPMDGFVYVGVRIHVYGNDETSFVEPRLVLGETVKKVFGTPWDSFCAKQNTWTPLSFPLTNKIIACSEDGLDLLIQHEKPSWGCVEFVAQRFDDFLEDESGLTYMFLNHLTGKVEWIVNEKNMWFKPDPMDGCLYPYKTKLIPSLLRLLDKDAAPWPDRNIVWEDVQIPFPFGT